jgi:hypothetical protein
LAIAEVPFLATAEVETLLFDTTTWLDVIVDSLDKTVAGIGKVNSIVRELDESLSISVY